MSKKDDGSLKTEYEGREWLTTKMAAHYLCVTTKTLYNLTSSGKVRYYKLGRSNRFLKEELRDLILANPKGVRHEC